MKRFYGISAVWLLAGLLAAGCQNGAADKPDVAGGNADRQYDIKGKVVAVGEDWQSVTLDHQDIPGLMKGMQMKFGVSDPGILSGIEPGDEVQGRLKVEEGEYTITQIEKAQP